MKIKVEFYDDVQAPAERIWDVLADVKNYPRWIGDISAVEPPASPVERDATFRFKLSGITYNITILDAGRPRRLSWFGVGMGNGIVTVHQWGLVEVENKTRVRNTEITSGWLAYLAYPLVKSGMSKIEAKWLADLKRKAEGQQSQP